MCVGVSENTLWATPSALPHPGKSLLMPLQLPCCSRQNPLPRVTFFFSFCCCSSACSLYLCLCVRDRVCNSLSLPLFLYLSLFLSLALHLSLSLYLYLSHIDMRSPGSTLVGLPESPSRYLRASLSPGISLTQASGPVPGIVAVSCCCARKLQAQIQVGPG